MLTSSDSVTGRSPSWRDHELAVIGVLLCGGDGGVVAVGDAEDAGDLAVAGDQGGQRLFIEHGVVEREDHGGDVAAGIEQVVERGFACRERADRERLGADEVVEKGEDLFVGLVPA